MEQAIFCYDDFRKYLANHYAQKKAQNPQRFSFRVFAKKAGFSTSNFLQLVIKGKRNLGLESIKKVGEAIGLAPREYHYFEHLVCFNQATTNEDKAKHYDKLVSCREYKEARLITESQTVYLSKWYYPVVREMIALPDFNPNPEWIAAHVEPAIESAQAKEAMDILNTLGLIEQTPTGRWVHKDAQLTTQGQGTLEEFRNYHRKMIHLGFEAIAKPPHKRDISGITMSVSPAKYKKIQERIAAFRTEIQELVQKPASQTNTSTDHQVSQVCQLNIQFFGLAG